MFPPRTPAAITAILAITARSLCATPLADDAVCLLQQPATAGDPLAAGGPPGEDGAMHTDSAGYGAATHLQIPYFHPLCQPTVDRLVGELNTMQLMLHNATAQAEQLSTRKGRIEKGIDVKRGVDVAIKALLDGLKMIGSGSGVMTVVSSLAAAGMAPHLPAMPAMPAAGPLIAAAAAPKAMSIAGPPRAQSVAPGRYQAPGSMWGVPPGRAGYPARPYPSPHDPAYGSPAPEEGPPPPPSGPAASGKMRNPLAAR
mmetsp:Transcript_2246/g.6480  ORF Transcript_2246/g.6480 Transcript_2246/m.6480 type:complete len:256 (+) Transcript_2246:103-870(+)